MAMTPSEVNTAARDIYNASGDSFFTDLQIYNWMWQGCHDLAKKAWLIESITTTATVAGTQAVPYPTNAIGIKRISVNGVKLKPITMRDDDAITLSNSASATQGSPTYYTEWNYNLYLRPIPDAIYTTVIHTYNDAAAITASSTLEIPTMFHFDLVDYILARMFMKDKDTQNFAAHMDMWRMHVADAVAYKNKKKRSDGFAVVQSEDTLPVTILGGT